jgi:hypothetical protein
MTVIATKARAVSGSPNETIRSTWLSDATSTTVTTPRLAAIVIPKLRKRFALPASLLQTSPAPIPTISVAITTVALFRSASLGERNGNESRAAAIAAIEAASKAGPIGFFPLSACRVPLVLLDCCHLFYRPTLKEL